MPWDRNLGGPRVQLELAEELMHLGHEVSVFDRNLAFPRKPRFRFGRYFQASFSEKAAAFVKKNGHKFDVIDAHQGNLPFTKASLGYEGLLVARSVGLYAFYAEFEEQAEKRWPTSWTMRAMMHRLLGWRLRVREAAHMRPSLEVADLISVPNRDEVAYVRDVLGLGKKCRLLMYGLTEERFEEFTQWRSPASVRLANKRVAFVGAWGLRKGSKDWPAIVRQVRCAVPDSKFLFITGCKLEVVLRDLNLPECDWIEVVPNFGCGDLPKLLSTSMIGAFPSYIEGFGLALLEKLAAGLPTVAYDVPGPRELLRHLPPYLMTPMGDTRAFSTAVISLLTSDLDQYTMLSEHCEEIARHFRWKNIALETQATYETALSDVQRDRGP